MSSKHSHPVLKRQPPPKRSVPKVVIQDEKKLVAQFVRKKRVGCCG